MARKHCPHCGAELPASERWAQTALSTLVAAPAVRDMATQVRCPKCEHVLVDSEVRYLRASRLRPAILFWLAGAGVFGWAVYQLLQG